MIIVIALEDKTQHYTIFSDKFLSLTYIKLNYCTFNSKVTSHLASS